MEDLTKNSPKALVKLSNGETILSRQIRLLQDARISEIVISTGLFEEQIIELTKSFGNIKFRFINNDIYDKSNSIYSLFLSSDYVKDDCIVLHGDLVFDFSLLENLIKVKDNDVCLINTIENQSEKDFKGKIENGRLVKISVDLFGDNCYALQPMYKLSKDAMIKWLNEIEKFINENKIKVYAENALNNILEEIEVKYLDYKDYYIAEIDDKKDLDRVSNEFRFFDYKNQNVINTNNYILEVKKYIKLRKLKKPLFVHGKHLINDPEFMGLLKELKTITFTGYSPNPKYEEVLKGLEVFKNNQCDSIISIGGGSCIDTAKAIKIFSGMNGIEPFIEQSPLYVNIPLLAIPTTAGTGTESTRYSVIYYKNEKQSLVHDCILPDTCILDKYFLYKLPEYHKKASLLDAFCQAIESYWSINSNAISKQYSKKAISLIISNYINYLDSDENSYENIMIASNLAGQAINITQTTAPHAMSYKITTLTGIAHGHAVSIVLPNVLDYMLNNLELCQDIRGFDYLLLTFKELSAIFHVDDLLELSLAVKKIIYYFKLVKPSIDISNIDDLIESVNSRRLKNSPVKINKNAINNIYKDLFDF